MRIWIFCTLLTIAACGAPLQPDGGRTDAGDFRHDAGFRDGGDAGVTDSGSSDSGADAGDAGIIDAGDGGSGDAGVDAGDGGSGDAGIGDGGADAGDAGPIDAGSDSGIADAGVLDAGAICDAGCVSGPHATASCDAGICVVACAAGTTRCSNVPADGCVDLQSDAKNCQSCGVACPAAPNALGGCEAGQCILACNSGRADCDGIFANGCEARLAVDLTNCGICGNVCPGGANANPTCMDGGCGIACLPGFANCDGRDSNGCEVNRNTDPGHCGSCTNACAGPAGAVAICDSGLCAWVCAAGRADCNGDAGDGCEVTLVSDVANCGVCARSCATGAGCVDGGCVCPAGQSVCGGVCVNLATDPANCGGCAAPCTSGLACSDGGCVVCPGTQVACATGCADLSQDTKNCGSCGHACLGGGCAGGFCQPVAMGIQTDVPPDALAVNGAQIFWYNQWRGLVVAASLDGGNASTIGSGFQRIGGLVADDGGVYWSNSYSSGFDAGVALWSWRDGGATQLQCPVGNWIASAIALSASYVYSAAGFKWSRSSGTCGTSTTPLYARENLVKDTLFFAAGNGSGNDTVNRSDLFGGNVVQLVYGQAPIADMSVSVDGASICWSSTGTAQNNGTIVCSDIDGGNLRTVAQSQNGPTVITVAGGAAYWVNQTTYDLLRVTLDGGVPARVASNVGPALARDGSRLYFAVSGTSYMSLMQLSY